MLFFNHGERVNRYAEQNRKEVKADKTKKPINTSPEGGDMMKGFFIPDGYLGWLPWIGRYQLFSTEQDYREYFAAHFEE